MVKSILMVTLDAMENDDQALRHFSVKNENGCYYCEAVQTMEASTKFVLSRFPINTIIAIGDDPSVFDLYRSRIQDYLEGENPETLNPETLPPEEERARIIHFIQEFQEEYSHREKKSLNRFFDELAGDHILFERFVQALSDNFTLVHQNPRAHLKWINHYLYTQQRASVKLEPLPINEEIDFQYVPAEMMTKQEHWVNEILGINPDNPDGPDEVRLYISLDNDSTVDGALLLNLLDILVVTPGSKVSAKKVYRVHEPAGTLTGKIEDASGISLSTTLVAAAHAFLNYSKTDMLVDFWEKYGDGNARISSMIYAARHVDIGISMCNVSEVQGGINRLREIFREKRSWKDDGTFGIIFGLISESIQGDYKNLLEGSGKISFIELIKWAYRHQLYQQVLTLIEAYGPENLVNTGVFYYCDDEADAGMITKLLAQQRLELRSYELYKMDDIEHYFIKYYDRDAVRLTGSRDEDRNKVYAAVRAQSLESRGPGKIWGHTVCDNPETVQNVLYAYYHLGVVRNKVSHADETGLLAESRLIVSENDISSGMLILRESIEYFILSYEKAMAEVAGKNPKIVLIPAYDVREAAERLRRDSYPQRSNNNRYGRPAAPVAGSTGNTAPAASTAGNTAPAAAPVAAENAAPAAASSAAEDKAPAAENDTAKRNTPAPGTAG